MDHRAVAVVLVGALCLPGLLGCADTPTVREESSRVERAEAALREGNPTAAWLMLQEGSPRTEREEVVFGEALVALGELEKAEDAFYRARESADLPQSVEFWALMGLGEVGLARKNGYAGMARFQEALTLAVDGGQRAEATLGQARAAFLSGDVETARRLRGEVSAANPTKLAALDQALREETVVSAPVTPAPRSEPLQRVPSPTRRAKTAPRRRGGPQVIDRSAWRARPVRRGATSRRMGGIRRITIHHTADPRLPGSTWGAMAERMRAYQAGHQQQRKWADIGYHFIVDREGRVWEGRELELQGAHAGNKAANRNNVGIALVGNFDRMRPSGKQKAALVELVTWLQGRYRVPAERVYTHAEMKRLYPEIKGTACPGKHLQWLVSSLRRGPLRGAERGTQARGN